MLVAIAVKRASKLLREYNERHRLGTETEADKLKDREMKQKQKDAKMIEAAEKKRKHMNLHFEDYQSPTKEYLMLCTILDLLVNSSWFNNWILLCIIVAGILVGVQTYPGLETNELINNMDLVILISFTAEVVFKMLSEGLAPHYYFIGPEYRWNVFDFCIVLFSLPIFPVGGGQVKLLRLVRLTRLAKVFRKIPQLQMIVMGLIGGLKSIVYIVILMLLTFYLFGIAGIIFFRDNDPFHFRSVEISMLTLLRVATFDAWGDILYINYFGCDVYAAGYYTNDPAEGLSLMGSLQYCNKPMAQPAIAGVYFILFCVINSFCILSLFIGAVSMSMAESMVQMKQENEDNRVANEKAKMGEVAERFRDKTKMDKKMKRKITLMELAFTGQNVEMHEEVFEFDLKNPVHSYQWLAKLSRSLAADENFQFFVTLVIVLAGVTVGMNTDRHVAVALFDELEMMDFMIQMVFLFECLLKFIAEEFAPWKYFNDNWNVFDFIVVVGSFMPTGSGSLVTILRLLRLLRVLKLMKALPQLQVIVSALLKGTSSVFFISVILFMFYYFFGIIGMTFFGENDPVNFGRLHFTLLILFQSSTLDAWADYMYISLYGCKAFGYDDYPHKCNADGAQFMLTAFFWIIFVLIGALVLLTLFIGVVSMGMEDAKAEQREEDAIDAKALKVALMENLEEKDVVAYREVFDVIDFTNSARIGKEEMRFGLGIAGLHLDDDEFNEIWKRVDRDNSSGIDFSEFLEFMFDLRNQINHEEKTCGTFTFSLIFTPNAPVESDILEDEDKNEWFGGKVQLNIISALGLQAKDVGFMESGKSDPFAEVYIGKTKVLVSPTIFKTLDPVWNFECEFELKQTDESEFCIKLQDYDQFSGADFLGQVLIDVIDIEPNKLFHDTRKVVTHPKRKIKSKDGKVVKRRQFTGLVASRFEGEIDESAEVEDFIKDLSLEKRLELNLQKSIEKVRVSTSKKEISMERKNSLDNLEHFDDYINEDGDHFFSPLERINAMLFSNDPVNISLENKELKLEEFLDDEPVNVQSTIKKSNAQAQKTPISLVNSIIKPQVDTKISNSSFHKFAEEKQTPFNEQQQQSPFKQQQQYSPMRAPFNQKQMEQLNSKTDDFPQNGEATNQFFQQFPGYNPNAFNPYGAMGQAYFPNMQMEPMARYQLPVHSQMQYLMQQSGGAFFPNLQQHHPISYPMNNILDLNQFNNQMPNQFYPRQHQFDPRESRDDSSGDDFNDISIDNRKMKPQPHPQFMYPPQSYTNPYNFQNNHKQWGSNSMSSNNSVGSNSSGLPNGRRKKCKSTVVSI